MKITQTIILAALLLAACVPLGSETKSIVIAGKTDNTVIERHEINKKYMALVSPEGLFYRGHDRVVEYRLKSGNKQFKLSHLSNLNPDRTLKEILNINNSNLWAIFELGTVTRESVQINIIVFDDRGIHHTQSVPDCKRLDLCAEHFQSLQSYSITPNSNNALLSIETLSGALTYDLRNGKLTNKEGKS